MPAIRWGVRVERVCLAMLFVWLFWLPLPFGSVVEGARLPLIAVPLLICFVAAAVRLHATRDRTNTAQPTRPWLIFGNGALLLLAAIALQLIPLPAGLHRTLSPDSYAIWSSGSRIATLAGATSRTFFPLSVDPAATRLELFRVAALLGAFATAALLIRTHTRRVVLAVAVCLAALFEALYGIRSAALQRYEIWGWTNHLIFHRVTGTFVNPNHYAHYLALALPLALFLVALAWHLSGPEDTPVVRRFLHFFERHLLMAGFGIATAFACLTAILLAQSRGTLLSTAASALAIAAMLPGRRIARVAFSAVSGLLIVVALVIFLGPERTVARFIPNEFERETFVGRRIGIVTAFDIWRRFEVFGSGAGTFERVVSMEQKQDTGKIYHHAHNDYAELGATTGTLGFMIGVVALLGGYVALLRMTFGPAAQELTWRRRAFQTAAAASLTLAMVHALFDFNFFIPSNPATLAAVVGAAVASLDHDRRTRRG